MPLKENFPSEAKPVVDILRRDVTKPEPPVLANTHSHNPDLARLRWSGICAMGLHPRAYKACPVTPEQFLGPVTEGIESLHVHKFYDWFDNENDGQAVVDAIWGANTKVGEFYKEEVQASEPENLSPV